MLGERKMKKLMKPIVAVALCACMLATSSTAAEAGWRASKSKTVNGYALTAKADLPYFSDSQGGGAWKTEASYKGKKDGNRITTSWSFYSIGGSVSWEGAGLSGDGTSDGGSYTYDKDTKAKANGYVYGTGFALYVGMISTASFTRGNTYYSISCKI